MSGSPNQKTILLVEDEPIIAMAEKQTLERNGYRVKTVNTGEQAVEVFGCAAIPIDLVLMDIDLGPGIDGTVAATRILALQDVPLVFLSSHTEKEYTDRMDRISSYGYILKSAGEMVLRASIKMAFRLFDANTALRRSEERFRTIVERAPEPIFIQTDACFAYLNPAALAMFGADAPEELVGRPVLDQVHPDFQALARERIRTINEDRAAVRTVAEQKWLRLDGSEIWVETLGEPYEYNGKQGALVFVRDRTAQKAQQDVSEWWHRLLQYVVRYVPNAIAVLDNELRHMYVSRRFLDDYGVEGTDIIGKHHYDVFPGIPEKWREAHRRVLAGEVLSSADDWFQDRSGTTRNTRWECRPWHQADGSIGGIILYTDVLAEHRWNQERSSASAENGREEFLQLLVKMATELINIPLAEVDAGITRMLREVGLFAGLDRVYVFRIDLKREIATNTHEWCAPGVPAEIDNLQAVPIVPFSDLVALHRKGELYNVHRVADLPEDDAVRRLLEPQGVQSVLLLPLLFGETNSGFVGFDAVREARRFSDSTIGLLTVLADLIANIQGRRVKEEELRRERTRLAGIIEGTNVGTWEWNVPTGENVFNGRWAEMLGYTRDEISPASIQTWERLVHPDDLEIARELLERHFRGELPVYEYECRMRHKNGSWLWVLDRGKVVSRTDEGEPLLVMGTHQDITERKRKESQILHLISEKETLLKEVQHRAKNTMNTMVSLLQLEAASLTDPRAIAALEDARSRFKSMEVLYDQLYRSESHDSVSLGNYLPDLVQRVVALFPIGRGVTVTTDVKDFPLEAKRVSTVGLIVNELVTNAMKYAFGEEGPATSESPGQPGRRGRSARSGNPALTVTGELTGELITVTVADNGPGLPGSLLSDEASGFGLTMVRALVEQLNGTLRFEQNGGAQVTFEFPA